MAVVVEDIRIKPTDFTLTSDTDYLLGNVGDKVTIEVDFRVEEIFATAAEVNVDRIIFNPDRSLVQREDTTDIIYCDDSTAFANYKVGDIVRWYNAVANVTSGNYIVYEKISDQAVKVYVTSVGDTVFGKSVLASQDPTNGDSYIFMGTPMTAVNYRWNFVGNEDADVYLDKIAEQLNQAKAGGLTVGGGAVPMIFDVPVTNNYGSATVEKLTGTTTAQKFRVIHQTIITPFFLAGQRFDLDNNQAPDYFDALNALKYIVSIDAGRTANDPNFIQTEEFVANDGNTGWFDENFNGNANKFSIESVTYKNQALATIGSVELTENPQYVEIVVKSADGVFSSGNTEFDLTFFILPENKDDYRNNGKTIIENFYLDKAFDTVGTAFSTGDNLGTDYQVISGAVGVFIDANTIQINATISLTANGVADLTSKDVDYFLGVSVQDHLKDTEESDRVHLKADIKPFYIDLSDDGMITITHKFLRHYESDVTTEGTSSLTARTEDDVLSYTQFYINRNGRETDNILLNSVKSALVAKKSDGSEFILEEIEQSLNGSLIVGDSQYIDVSSERNFKMPSGEQRKTIKTKRRSDLDTVDFRYYEVYYPFLFRWEYWVALAGVNSDAFDTNEPNNGFNNNWHRYNTLTDWDIYFRTEIRATKNGNSLLYQEDSLITTFDYEEGTDWINEDITVVDADTLTSLGTILKSPCKVIASKEYSGPTPPASADDVEWVLRIEVYEQGGISDIRFLSSVYDWTQNSWFKSVDTSNKVVKDKIGNVFTAEALVDFTKLPDNARFKISARIYDEAALVPIPPDVKLLENGDPKLTEAGGYKIKD